MSVGRPQRLRRRSIILGHTVVLLLACANLANAQRDAQITVAGLHIRGVEAVDEPTLKAALVTKASRRLFVWRRRPHTFERSAFEADLKRIAAFYADRGYPDARVSNYDLSLSDDQKSVDISITIVEGDPIVVDDVRFEGFADPPDGSLERLRRQLPIQPGDPRNRSNVERARQMATRLLQDRGYPFATAKVDEQPGGSDRRITLVLTAEIGEPARYGPISITGNMGVGEDVIRRALAFHEGEPFSLSRIEQSQRRLYDLGLFQLVNVDTVRDEARAGEVPMRVTVAEAQPRQLRFSAGYGTEERVRGETKWTHLNFFGGARTASVEGKWSSLDRGVRTEFRQPYVFAPSLALGLSGQRWFADEPAYQLDTLGGRLTMTRDLGQRDAVAGRGARSSVSASLNYEAEEFVIATDVLADLSVRDQLIATGLDPRTGAGRGRLTAMAIDFSRSTTSSVLDSRRGYVLQAHVERAGGLLGGDYDYNEATLEGRHYQTLAGFGVLANRMRAGSIDGRGSDVTDVPFFKRYFLGGSSGLRGWGRFQVAPLSGSGLPIGGHSFLELSSELRTVPFGKLALVAFIDAGNVWTDAWRITLSDLRYDVGPGLRYATPIGPLRVDVAYQLNPIPELLVEGLPQTRRWRLHFSIGQAF